MFIRSTRKGRAQVRTELIRLYPHIAGDEGREKIDPKTGFQGKDYGISLIPVDSRYNDRLPPALSLPSPRESKMNETTITKPPTWFWVVAILALIWNLLGLMIFVNHIMMSPETLDSLAENEQALYQDMPVWANVAFGLAVIAGTLGCIFLILRTRLAIALFVLSLVGIVIHDVYNYFFSDVLEVHGMGPIGMSCVVFVIGLLLIGLSRHADQKKWFR